MVDILLEGDGLAVAAVTKLLAGHCAVGRVAGERRKKLPVVLLNRASGKLYEDVFERGLPQGVWPIERRVVRWGGRTQEFPHAALVVGEEELLRHVERETEVAAEGAFRVVASRGEMERVGQREAVIWRAWLKPGVRGDACWVEAVPSGWLFAVARSEAEAVVIEVGGGLEESQLVAGVIGETEFLGRFASEPGIARELRGQNWVACGGAALRFDPICGEGTGHALREAILLSAILRRGDREEGMWAMYEDRLRAGFSRHLEQCLALYGSGEKGPWWEQQVKGLEAALQKYRHVPRQPKYRLEGFRLV